MASTVQLLPTIGSDQSSCVVQNQNDLLVLLESLHRRALRLLQLPA